MISPAHDSLFTPKLWDAALEKYALVTHLTVQLFNVDARLVLGPIHPTPVFQLFEKKGYDPGIFPECARRCIAQTDSRQAITVSQVQGLAAVGAPLMLDDKIVGAAVGGYVFQDFIQSSDIQSLARQAGIHFAELWELVRHQPPVPQRRLQVHGELLQVLGDSLLGEHHRARQYEEAAAALRRWNEDLEARVGERTAELLASQDRLRGLAAELNLAEQHERKRLAVELHDHLQQILVLGRLNLGRGKRLAKSLPACVKVIKETDELLLDALKYTHTLVAELSPPVLRDHGLAAGLQWLGEYMKKYNVDVMVTAPEEELKLPEDQVILLFQSVRELLINSSKYAGTGQASVTLEQRDGRLLIEVSDRGAGFDLAAAATPSGSSSKFGLFSIRERMKSLGGSFDLESAQGQGTTVILSLPLVSSVECSVLSPELSGRNSALPGRSALSPLRPPSEALGSAARRASTQDSALQQRAEIRVLLVDDHAMLRQGLRTMLEGYKDVEIVGEAWDGQEAVQAVDQLRPGVVVMDINMPKMNGIDATAQIKARHPETIVIGLSVNADGKNQEAMMKAGAHVLLSKEAAIDQLHETIQTAAHEHSTSLQRSA